MNEMFYEEVTLEHIKSCVKESHPDLDKHAVEDIAKRVFNAQEQNMYDEIRYFYDDFMSGIEQ